MQISALINASYAYGGPWKLLLLNLRGGQLIGTILAFSCYAWIISVLSSHHLPVASANKAIVGLGSALSFYLLGSMPATWLYFEKAWFRWTNMGADLLSVAGSIAIAVLTRGTSDCSGIFIDGEKSQLSTSTGSEACKLQKVVFATGVCNSLMFFITFLLIAALRSGLMNREAKQETKDRG